VFVKNGPLFTIGDGSQPALLQMTGPTNLFANSVRIQTNATLSGCLTINGTTLNDGTLLAGCGGQCALMQDVTNNGTIELLNGTTLDLFGQVVNNGSIIVTGGTVRNYSTFVNNGTLTGNYQDMHNLWTNSGGGKWEAAANWSQQAPPTSFGVSFPTRPPKTVLIDGTTMTHPETMTVTALTLASPRWIYQIPFPSPTQESKRLCKRYTV